VGQPVCGHVCQPVGVASRAHPAPAWGTNWELGTGNWELGGLRGRPGSPWIAFAAIEVRDLSLFGAGIAVSPSLQALLADGKPRRWLLRGPTHIFPSTSIQDRNFAFLISYVLHILSPLRYEPLLRWLLRPNHQTVSFRKEDRSPRATGTKHDVPEECPRRIRNTRNVLDD
jgi:hypothetical protein